MHMIHKQYEATTLLSDMLEERETAAAAAASAAAKSLQSCLTLCDPIDGSPPGSSVHGIFQARVLEWGAIAFSDMCLRLFHNMRDLSQC